MGELIGRRPPKRRRGWVDEAVRVTVRVVVVVNDVVDVADYDAVRDVWIVVSGFSFRLKYSTLIVVGVCFFFSFR